MVHLKSGVKLKEVEGGYQLVTEEAAAQLIANGAIWNPSTHKASVTIGTSTDYQIQWQKNTTSGTWTIVPKGNQSVTISDLNHNDTIYARLWDGTSAKKEATVKVVDGQSPEEATITALPTTEITEGEKITATVVHTDNQSGVKVADCKWKFTTSQDTKLGTEATSYAGEMSGSFTSESENIECTANTAGTYWLHVLTVDKGGNAVETVSGTSVTVNQKKEVIKDLEEGKVYYGDKDGDGTPDGVIFADLAKGSNGEKQWRNTDGKYTIPKSVTNPKQYTVSNESYSGSFGTGKVLTASGTGEERFYIMSLSDLSSTAYTWYDAANGKQIDYSLYNTSGGFGEGKENTAKMITKWNANEYGIGKNTDVWSVVQGEAAKGWFVPSKGEWAAFGNELGITKSNYSSKGLSVLYWTSTQAYPDQSRMGMLAWVASLGEDSMIKNGVGTLYRFVRLGTTF